MKQLTDQHQSLHGRSTKLRLTAPIKLALLAVLPLIASASTAGSLITDALLPDVPISGTFDWPRFSLLAAGVIALVRARVTTTNDINVANQSGNNI